MSDRDYLYGHVCAHGSLARSCQVCDLEDEVRRLQAEVAGADENVASWQGIAADLREERDHLQAEVRQLRTECEEVEYQLHGGTDADGAVSRGLDGLDLPGKANVVHSTAVDALIEVYELRAAIREHDRRYTLDGGGRARCYPVMGELLPGDDDD